MLLPQVRIQRIADVPLYVIQLFIFRPSQTSQVPNYSKTIAFLRDDSLSGEVDVCCSSRSEERPSPEGFGTSAGDPQRSMSCQKTVKSLAGQFGGSSGDNGRFSPALSAGTARCGLGMPVAVDLGARRSEEERKVARCDKCSLTLVALKKQALSLLVQNHFSSKVSASRGHSPPLQMEDSRTNITDLLLMYSPYIYIYIYIYV